MVVEVVVVFFPAAGLADFVVVDFVDLVVVDLVVDLAAASGLAAADFIVLSVFDVVVLAAEAGAALVVVAVVVLAEAFTGTAPGAEHLANLPEASRHF